MIAQIPKQPSTSADEGAAAHELAAKLLEAGIRGADTLDKNRKFTVGQPLFNGVICTDEMVDAVESYVMDVVDIMEAVNPELWGFETDVKMPMIYATMKGKVNAWAFDTVASTLYVWQFEYGRGLIEVYENQQLILYVLGLVDLLDLDKNSISIDMRIVQPRGFHADGPIRSWKVTSNGPIDLWLGLLQDAAAVASNPQHAETRSGKHCKYCRAKYACASAQSAGLLAVEFSNQPIPVGMDGATLGTYLKILHRSGKSIADMIKGLEAQTKIRLQNGEAIPGYELEPSYGHLNWNGDAAGIIKILENMFKVDLSKSQHITPTQAINDAKIPRGIVEAYSSKPDKGEKLVADDGSKARRIFEKQPEKDI